MNSKLEKKNYVHDERNLLNIKLTNPEYNVNLKPHSKFTFTTIILYIKTQCFGFFGVFCSKRSAFVMI